MDFFFAAVWSDGLGLRSATSFDLDAGWRFALVPGLTRGPVFVPGLRLETGLDLVMSLRWAGAEGDLAATKRRRGGRLAPGAADLVFLADDARFME